MSDDAYDSMDAETEYLMSGGLTKAEHLRRSKVYLNREIRRAKALGYTDEEILGMDRWPENPKEAEIAKSVRARLGLNQEMKARTSPIGEPDRYSSEAINARKAAFDALPREEKINKIKKGMRMINKTRVIADLRQAIADAQKELALLERIPAEPSERMTSFTVTFPGSTKPYVYVGLRVDGDWLMSGKSFEGSNWTWSGIFKRFEEIHATVSYISTPTEYRHEQVYR